VAPALRIGLYLSSNPPQPLERLAERAAHAEQAGFHTLWISQLYDYDALTLIALLGRSTQRIELGTWVVPTYPRHPTALAQQALTAQVATGNRLLLAIGVSHRVVIEKRLGLDFSRPVRHMREYLEVLLPLLAGEQVEHDGQEFRVRLAVGVPCARRPPVLIAALGPQMLRLAGRLADGAAIWLGGPRYLRDFAIPALREAAARAARSAPRIAVGLPIAVHSDRSVALASVARILGRSSALPSYQAVLEREGAKQPEDVAIVGSEREVRDQLEALAKLGVTDFNAVAIAVDGEPRSLGRTLGLLGDMAQETDP
jgi:F420-dependent oxidoreductase-like protein